MSTAPQALAGLVFAPVSPAVATLLHKLQEQLILEAAAAAAPADPMGPLQAPGRADYADRIEYRAENGRDTWRRRRVCPAGWGGPDGMPWHPSHWLLDSSRIDTHGVEWSCVGSAIVQVHVMDDFGALVPVARA